MRLKLLFFNLRHVSTTGHPEKLKKVCYSLNLKDLVLIYYRKDDFMKNILNLVAHKDYLKSRSRL